MQRCHIVNVEPCRLQHRLQPRGRRPLQRLPAHLVAGPRNVAKHRDLRMLQADQVIAAVIGRSRHHRVAGRCQRRGGIDRELRRQVGAVGIEQAHCPVTRCKQRRDGLQPAAAEASDAGMANRSAVCQRKPRSVRQVIIKHKRRTIGRIGEAAGDGDGLCREADALGRIPEVCSARRPPAATSAAASAASSSVPPEVLSP